MSEDTITYKGAIISKTWEYGIQIWKIQGVEDQRFATLELAMRYVDSYSPETDPQGGLLLWNDPSIFSPDWNQWVGRLKQGVDDARENKLVALGPAPPGTAGKVEGFILLALIARLSKTPQGLKILNNWGIHYLDAMKEIIKGISVSSAANVYNCLVNQYAAIPIYQRMGLMSAHDAIQTKAWVDHVMGLMITAGYFKDSLGGLTTLVNATSITGAGKTAGPSWEGLAALGKLYSPQGGAS
jgi:hypothetical protein